MAPKHEILAQKEEPQEVVEQPQIVEQRVETFTKEKPLEKVEKELRKLINLGRMRGRMWHIIQISLSKGGEMRGTLATGTL